MVFTFVLEVRHGLIFILEGQNIKLFGLFITFVHTCLCSGLTPCSTKIILEDSGYQIRRPYVPYVPACCIRLSLNFYLWRVRVRHKSHQVALRAYSCLCDQGSYTVSRIKVESTTCKSLTHYAIILALDFIFILFIIFENMYLYLNFYKVDIVTDLSYAKAEFNVHITLPFISHIEFIVRNHSFHAIKPFGLFLLIFSILLDTMVYKG